MEKQHHFMLLLQMMIHKVQGKFSYKYAIINVKIV